MKKITAFILVLIFFANAAKAQYVNIPDSSFRAFLISKYPICFNSAGMMDTTCGAIVNEVNLFLDSKGIASLEGLTFFSNLRILWCEGNYLKKIPLLPSKLKIIKCSSNQLDSLPKLPDSLIDFICISNRLKKLPELPKTLINLNCNNNLLDSLPQLPNSLVYLDVSYNNLKNINNLPFGVMTFNCTNNKLSTLPSLNDSLQNLNISNNEFIFFPVLPKYLINLDCSYNQFSIIDKLPESLITLIAYDSIPICFGKLPQKLQLLLANYGYSVKCLPNYPDNCCYFISSVVNSCFVPVGLCNPTNNPSHCQAFPQIQSNLFIDNNSNGIKDSNEIYKQNVKVQLSNSDYAYTNSNGQFQIAADSLGVYTLAIIPPPFYTAVPSTINFNFSNYDTLVNLTDIALKPSTLIDSLSIKATPINWAARPGFAYPYHIQYENVGTTILSPNINFSYDNNLITFDSSSNNSVTSNGSSLSLQVSSLSPGQTGSFVAYFKVKTTATLGTDLLSVANISGGTSNAVDSAKTMIRGSYDPNDKQATPTITKQDAIDGKFINYTIRFQNTGTDTAFNVVIVDTLSSLLEVSNFQIISTSHLCKTTIKNNIVYFEFIDINLPDSGKNNLASNGFINFKIKPTSSVTTGNIIPNKAHIYFDYNSSIKTNIATTTIINPLPLKLVLFNAVANENNNILVYWNTKNEVNTAYFILEKSYDGINFTNTAEIAAKGFGDNSYFYSIPKTGKLFLRLRMVDKDGIYSYSKIILINAIVTQPIFISPNPAKNYLNINNYGTSLIPLKCKLLNSIGVVVKSFELKSGFQAINIVNLPVGVYYLQTGAETIKVIVEK